MNKQTNVKTASVTRVSPFVKIQIIRCSHNTPYIASETLNWISGHNLSSYIRCVATLQRHYMVFTTKLQMESRNDQPLINFHV